MQHRFSASGNIRKKVVGCAVQNTTKTKILPLLWCKFFLCHHHRFRVHLSIPSTLFVCAPENELRHNFHGPSAMIDYPSLSGSNRSNIISSSEWENSCPSSLNSATIFALLMYFCELIRHKIKGDKHNIVFKTYSFRGIFIKLFDECCIIFKHRLHLRYMLLCNPKKHQHYKPNEKHVITEKIQRYMDNVKVFTFTIVD